MSKRPKPGQRPVKPTQASFSRAGVAAGAVLALLAAILAGWHFYRPSVTAADGTNLGALASGVNQADLNLIVLTLDTTRADKLGCYGEPEKATPNLDRLAAGAVRFEQVMSAIPLTLPA